MCRLVSTRLRYLISLSSISTSSARGERDSQYFGHQHLDELVALDFQLLEYFLSLGGAHREY